MHDKKLRWVPRILAILMILFISLFALDVFGEGYPFWGTIVALFMHLIPTYILIGALILAWKWDDIGGMFFIGLGFFYMFLTWGRAPPLTYLFMSGPLFLIGFLFILNKKRLF